MSFLSLLPPTLAATARDAVSEARKLELTIRRDARLDDAAACGYLDHTPAKPSPLAIVTRWDDAPTIRLSYHPLDRRQDPKAGNARGEALGLAIASPERRAQMLKAGCRPGPSYCPTFLAPAGFGSGKAHVGQPIGLWDDAGRDDAPPRPAGWTPRPAWDAIPAKPSAQHVWTQEGWAVDREVPWMSGTEVRYVADPA